MLTLFSIRLCKKCQKMYFYNIMYRKIFFEIKNEFCRKNIDITFKK